MPAGLGLSAPLSPGGLRGSQSLGAAWDQRAAPSWVWLSLREQVSRDPERTASKAEGRPGQAHCTGAWLKLGEDGVLCEAQASSPSLPRASSGAPRPLQSLAGALGWTGVQDRPEVPGTDGGKAPCRLPGLCPQERGPEGLGAQGGSARLRHTVSPDEASEGPTR